MARAAAVRILAALNEVKVRIASARAARGPSIFDLMPPLARYEYDRWSERTAPAEAWAAFVNGTAPTVYVEEIDTGQTAMEFQDRYLILIGKG